MISNYLAQLVLDDKLNTTLYLALYSVAPNADGTGGTELSGGNYSRVAIAAGDWAAASGKQKATDTTVTLPVPSADWLECVAAALISTSSGAGNVYFHETLDEPFTNLSGQVRSFAAGAIVAKFTQ